MRPASISHSVFSLFKGWNGWLYGTMLLFSVFLSSCAATAHLQPNQLLLKGEPVFNRPEQVRIDTTARNPFDNFINFGTTTIDPGLLFSSVKTHPNRRMILPKTYLHFYNLGRTLQKYEYPPETLWKFFFPKNGLFDSIANFLVNTAGEPPVLVDTALMRQDAENLRTVYFSQGFWDAKIYPGIDTCRSQFNKGKARVVFSIEEGRAAIIDKVWKDITSDSIRKVIYKTLGESFLREGDAYNEDNLLAERNRITDVMRSNGFYTFNPRQVTYEVDKKPVEVFGTLPLNYAIQDYFPVSVTIRIKDTPPPYRVGRVTMLIEPAEYDPERDDFVQVITPALMSDSLRRAWGLNERMYSDSAKVTFNAYARVLEHMNLNFIESEITLKTGDMYSLAVERETQRRLQSLGIFKFVLLKHIVDEETGTINFVIQTVLLPRFQLKAGTEGFFKNDRVLKNNFAGVGGEIGYTNKMLFKGSEQLVISAKGSLSFPIRNDSISLLLDASATASLRIPRIVIPFLGRLESFQGNPNTALSLSFTRQQSVNFSRNAGSLDWTYNWFDLRLGPSASSSLSPYTITFIQSKLNPTFLRQIASIDNLALRALLLQDYKQRFSSVGRYKFTWSDYMSTRRKPTIFVQPLLEIGGNTPFLFDRFFRFDESWKDHQLSYILYGQFVKVACELKNYFPLTKKSEFVVRNYIGVADPWNFTPFVPFESRFYSGGTNSMRGWQSNTLGPGTYLPSQESESEDDINFLFAPGGEAIFETNLELRFDAYDWIELALFTDFGNVWFLPGSKINYPGANLSRESYLQLGIDGGVGIRFDFSFFVFRIDVARKIYSPAIQDFVTRARRDEMRSNIFQLNFGIGYPF